MVGDRCGGDLQVVVEGDGWGTGRWGEDGDGREVGWVDGHALLPLSTPHFFIFLFNLYLIRQVIKNKFLFTVTA